MSGLLGAKTQSTSPIRYNGVQIGQSNQGAAVPLQYGQGRLPFNLVWYGAFSSTPNSGAGSGKGGGGQTTSYTYKTSFAAGICEGPITEIVTVYNDKDVTSLQAIGLNLFTGASGQATWGFLTVNFPAQAIPYDHLCYVSATNYVLGSSASLPNITFEVRGFLCLLGTTITLTGNVPINATSCTMTSKEIPDGTWNITFSTYEARVCTVTGNLIQWQAPLVNIQTGTATAGIAFDASPAAIILDYLTDPNHGTGFPASQVGTLTGANSYESYCLSLGIGLSPAETTQRASADFISELMKITNSDVVWSAGTLRIVPYADSPVSGNGYSYTPNLTPEFIFTDDDYLEPIDFKRKATADTYNHVRVEYVDRMNQYNTAIVEATDLGDIALTGERVMDTLSYHEISNAATAGIVGQLVLQNQLYERNTITFKVRADYSLLEPMDYIGIVDVALGYGSLNSVGQYTSGQVFRITKITDDDKDVLEIEAMEVPGAVRTAAIYNWANVQGYNANWSVAPGSVQPPAFFEAYETLVGPSGGRELWLALCGPNLSPSWGGCNVYLSFDNVTYTQIGVQAGGARYGTIGTALPAGSDPDTVYPVNVLLNNTADTLTSGTQADADDDRTLISIGSGETTEILSYSTATLVAAGEYNLTTYLRRGQYGTSIQEHSAGAQFIRLDGNIFKISVDPGYIGVPLYFKFTSFNIYGRATELISAVPMYSYTMGQATSAYNVISTSTFIVNPGSDCVVYSPTTAFKVTTGADAWDSSVISTQSYTNGCTLECSPSQTSDYVMMGITGSPNSSNSYTNLGYAWYMLGNGTLQIYINGIAVTDTTGATESFGAYTTSDLMAITYDGKHVVWYHNGAIAYSVPVVLPLPLFAQFCFYTPGASLYGMTYDNQAPTSNTITLIPYNSNAAVVGNTVTQTNIAAAAWTSGAYANQGYSSGCALSWTINSSITVAHAVIGLTYSPTTSVNYTNINYGIDCYPGGPLFIFESGVTVNGITGAYTQTSILEIIYDGKHVQFFCDAVLLYSVPLTLPSGASLYPQISIGSNTTVVGNISWGPTNQAVTPFTLVPLSIGTAASGTKITSTTFEPNEQYGVRGWKTNESYSNGCTISGVCLNQNASYFGLTTNPVLSTGANIIAGWYPHSDVQETHIIFNGEVAKNIPTTLATDVLTVEYDTFYFYWFLNNTLQYQAYSPNAGALYLYGDMFYQGIAWAQLSFGPNGALTPNPFIATNKCVTHDSTAAKPAVDSGWDSSVYSINGYELCHLQFKNSYTSNVLMFGLSTQQNLPPSNAINYNPATGFEALNYAWYINPNLGATYQIYESGALVGNFGGAPQVTDLLAITYDGANISYLLNSAVMRTTTISGAPALFANSSFYGAGSTVNSLSFGPGTALDTVPTASIDANAATSVAVVTTAGPINPATTATTLASITVGPYAYATTVVATTTGMWSYTNGATAYNAVLALILETSHAVGTNPLLDSQLEITQNFPANFTTQDTFALEGTISLAAGAVETIFLYGQTLPSSVNPLARNFEVSTVTLKAEVIKV